MPLSRFFPINDSVPSWNLRPDLLSAVDYHDGSGVARKIVHQYFRQAVLAKLSHLSARSGDDG
jgi:hypothetical protein